MAVGQHLPDGPHRALGHFGDAANPVTTYSPSAGDRTAGTVTLTLTTNNPAGPCPASSDAMILSIGAPLTGAVISGSGNACVGASSWFALTVTGGGSPYQVIYTLDGGAPVTYPGYTNGTHINLGALPASSHTVHIVSIQDACLGFVPAGGLPSDYVFSINANNTVSAASSTPTLCISTPLTAITHTTTGATGIGAATGLPAGVTAAWASNTITISGTPTASGTFNYSIPLTGGCGTVSATGTITVTANMTVSAASSTPTLCISTPLTAITHTTARATGIGAATGLPAGVTAS